MARRTPAMTVALAFAILGSSAPEGRAAPVVTTTCGPVLKTVVKAQRAVIWFLTNTEYHPVKGASVRVAVPAGKQRCVLIQFSASAACNPTDGQDICYLRALDNGESIHPGDDIPYTGEQFELQAHSYLWAKRIGPGTHTLSIETRSSSGESSTIGFWSLKVDVAE